MSKHRQTKRLTTVVVPEKLRRKLVPKFEPKYKIHKFKPDKKYRLMCIPFAHINIDLFKVASGNVSDSNVFNLLEMCRLVDPKTAAVLRCVVEPDDTIDAPFVEIMLILDNTCHPRFIDGKTSRDRLTYLENSFCDR